MELLGFVIVVLLVGGAVYLHAKRKAKGHSGETLPKTQTKNQMK